ncbi:hypothetical protein LF1_52210 [Rubripirellula obstinata]|uniref:DUF3592 domain-containing protein n=1 Tax=Rubripirellula obstinata TaxID=406547 RepID=A0A5B1CAR9_9BACT|nr:hypothetical protein [Rubripirellula obstinata]KAA1257365.1 hypothetical protein LF1_52140 [Rubripirellula obstinata]KAA1257372.1 hypothetical protein LF1_52210 [Rubripirellula obstinata]
MRNLLLGLLAIAFATALAAVFYRELRYTFFAEIITARVTSVEERFAGYRSGRGTNPRIVADVEYSYDNGTEMRSGKASLESGWYQAGDLIQLQSIGENFADTRILTPFVGMRQFAIKACTVLTGVLLPVLAAFHFRKTITSLRSNAQSE